eukprot:CAMPEP_0180493716 /NCGR_PEP_ID=MMETSP1036_2-20121128/40854_1 /TAXON_ID=632150 /ORGANISM="Azadinium spinosum, Strain 3D9" /LENGTH=48 /DNA_ID= /DNA_START= /DNA_END= /DNA_ORIENTATION=
MKEDGSATLSSVSEENTMMARSMGRESVDAALQAVDLNSPLSNRFLEP